MQAVYQSGEPWLDAVLSYLEGNLGLARSRIEAIPKVELIEPEGTFLLWVDFRNLGLEPEKLTAFLRAKALWGVTRGPAFGVEGEGFARVNMACTRARLGVALDQLAQAVSEAIDR